LLRDLRMIPLFVASIVRDLIIVFSVVNLLGRESNHNEFY